MKTIYLILFTFFVVYGLKAQWFYQNSGTSLDLNSVHFLNSNSGYAVGNSGIILKTIDGGSNWTLLGSGTSQDLQSVYFCDLLTGFSVGDLGTILKTANGGASWSMVNVNPNPYLTSVYFPSDSCGYAVGYKTTTGMSCDAIIFKTIDGGDNWNENFITEGLLHSVHFPSLNIGYAVGRMWGPGAYARILKTIDGGLNWSVTDYYGSYGFVSTFFAENDTGYCAGYALYPYVSNILFTTNNGGLTWAEKNFSHYQLTSIYFLSNDIGYAAGYNDWGGDGTIFKIEGGGQNWIRQDSTLPDQLRDVHFPVIDTGYVVGLNGLIFKTTNGGNQTVGLNDYKPKFKFISVFPNPGSNIITFNIPIEGNVSIYNNRGQEILKHEFLHQTRTFNISKLANGIYYFKVVNENGTQIVKFIKN
ncbi:MAG: T9SS type A sorting domain-containing protein [Bacteroidales bacterium]|nr:T9SS type A sorting domain-containing protein [Bacteroidales bacterium]